MYLYSCENIYLVLRAIFASITRTNEEFLHCFVYTSKDNCKAKVRRHGCMTSKVGLKYIPTKTCTRRSRINLAVKHILLGLWSTQAYIYVSTCFSSVFLVYLPSFPWFAPVARGSLCSQYIGHFPAILRCDFVNETEMLVCDLRSAIIVVKVAMRGLMKRSPGQIMNESHI